MRSRSIVPLRLCLGLLVCCVAVSTVLSGDALAAPTVDAALRLTPKQRADAEVDEPAAADISRCTISAEKIDGKTGWTVRDPSSRILRRFIDTNGDNVVDLWCFYRGGIEVYRDIDTNFNGKPDQFRWLNTAGTRWGIDRDENGRIDNWKAISAQEVSAEVVAALASKDEQRLRLVILTPEELRDLGLGEAISKSIATKLDAANNMVRQATNRKAIVAPDGKWMHFSAAQPGLVPAGTDGSTKDLMVYENVAAMIEAGGKQSLLNIGTMVAVGDTWKLAESPSADADGTGTEVAGTGIFFKVPVRGGAAGTTAAGDSISEEVQKLLAKLEGIEKSMATATDEQKAKLNDERCDALQQLMETTKDATQRDAWGHQLADTISAAVQSDSYPDGLKRLEALAENAEKDKSNLALAAYFRYRALMAGYTVAMKAKDGGDFAAVQAKWLKSLEQYIKDYPNSADTSDAMLQLAVAHEFAGEDAKASEWYGSILEKFPQSAAAKKAGGARRRLDSVGQVLAFRGPDLAGRTVDLSRYRGRVVLVQYWATWCEPCKADMTTLKALVGLYGQQGFSVVGINVDQDRQLAADFLAQEKLPWANIYEPGGLDSRLASELGILTLPTMLLLDQQGKVVNRSIHASQVENELKTRLKGSAPAKK